MAVPALNPDRIGDAGRQLFGEHWQAPLAKALGVDTRLLRYWLSGQERPTIGHLRTLAALLEHSTAASRRLADYFRSALGQPDRQERDHTFDARELRRVDRRTVEHIPTGSRASFYEYVEPPPEDYIPGATITNAAMWGEDDLVRFNVAAWKLLSDYRYRYHVDRVRHAVRAMRSGASADEIVLAVQRDYPSFEKWRILACLREMQEKDGIKFAARSGVVPLADPKPIVREE